MSERLTIADSKKAFHRAFPYVIPPIYRRITDELLVELHLLSHQKGFKPDVIFAIGLRNVFETFTKGYRPEKHLESLFESICTSNGIDPIYIRNQSSTTLELIKDYSMKEVESWFRDKGLGAPEKLRINLEVLSKGTSQYSRIISIGLLAILNSARTDETAKNEDAKALIKEISNNFGFSMDRVERDLNQYTSSLDKMSQALEVMREAIEHDRRKKQSESEAKSTD